MPSLRSKAEAAGVGSRHTQCGLQRSVHHARERGRPRNVVHARVSTLAPNPRRVRIFAAEKGIELVLEDVDLLAGQNRTPEFLAKNSSGGVPVLELDDGSCLSE